MWSGGLQAGCLRRGVSLVPFSAAVACRAPSEPCATCEHLHWSLGEELASIFQPAETLGGEPMTKYTGLYCTGLHRDALPPPPPSPAPTPLPCQALLLFFVLPRYSGYLCQQMCNSAELLVFQMINQALEDITQTNWAEKLSWQKKKKTPPIT